MEKIIKTQKLGHGGGELFKQENELFLFVKKLAGIIMCISL